MVTLQHLSIKNEMRDFPGGPVIKTLNFHCRRAGQESWTEAIYLKPLTRIRVPVSLLERGGTEKQAILPEPRKAPGRRGGGAKGSFRFRAQKPHVFRPAGPRAAWIRRRCLCREWVGEKPGQGRSRRSCWSRPLGGNSWRRPG
ncbi:hypothetical protein R6Z07F_014058 [Ovis aries]